MEARPERIEYFVQRLNRWNGQPEVLRVPVYQLGELWEVAERLQDRGVPTYVNRTGLLVVA